MSFILHDFSIRACAPTQILALQSAMVAIYRAAFTPPPYQKPESEILDFAATLPTQFNRAGYRFFTAFVGESDQLAGFAYGYATSAARWWLEHVRPALSPQAARDWLEDSYQLVEIAVDPRFQGQGAGRRLHDALLAACGYQRAVLSTLQAETPAHHLYRSRGWRVLCQDLFFTGVPRRYQILGLVLNSSPLTFF
jgi:ribosomal protein S18 acetylase RimI-like enzyme